MDYSKFEGKVIIYISSNGNKYDGLIAGCDYHVGITIVDNNNKDFYLYCFRGPSYDPLIEDNNYHKESFENAIAMFKDGFFDRRIDIEIDKKHGEYHITGQNASAATCSFNK